MSDDFFIEQLIIDDSFANYCFQRNKEDILFWEDYIRSHPYQHDKIAEARELVMSLHTMLKQRHEETGEEPKARPNALKLPASKQVLKKMFRYTAAAAAVIFIILSGKKVVELSNRNHQSPGTIPANTAVADLLVYKTNRGEKKIVMLPDSSRLTLNAGSELRVDHDFGKLNRTVYLTGEALFDVTHNSSLPFIVHIDQYDIRVVGTLFNVKAYPGEEYSETALVRGKVEISLKNNAKKINLTSNQKAVIDNTGSSVELTSGNAASNGPAKGIVLLPLSYSTKDSMVIETAWSQNRLEIVNESFADMKERLERWYNVQIVFKDKEVSDYRFTAAFEKESIEEVLLALQNAYHFRYDIKGNEITISK